MPQFIKITTLDYYHELPEPALATGDIWEGLPTMGLLEKMTVNGIVITPACDLAQCKTAVISYLPIISITEYFSSSLFYNEIWISVLDDLKNLGMAEKVHITNRFELPDFNQLDTSHLVKNKKNSNSIEKVKKYYEFVKDISCREIKLIVDIIGQNKIKKITDAILKNAHKNDIHFLPKLAKNYSPCPDHSVVLLRYPITVSTKFLENAMDVNATWDMDKNNYSNVIQWHLDKYPIRMGRLKDDFLSDLITRYIGMQMRLGSRDFDRNDLKNFSNDIIGDL